MDSIWISLAGGGLDSDLLPVITGSCAYEPLKNPHVLVETPYYNRLIGLFFP